MRRRYLQWIVLVGFLLAVAAIAGAGSLFTSSGVSTWYRQLVRPAWTPPNWLFGPVWTVLYASMAAAGWLVWRRGRYGPVGDRPAPADRMGPVRGGLPAARRALGLWALQLLLNGAWSPIFFGLHSLAGGLIVIALLWLAILATLMAFRPLSRPAAILMLPYLAWVTFAACLNLALWRLNP